LRADVDDPRLAGSIRGVYSGAGVYAREFAGRTDKA
jgi:hypothetical protein